MHPVVHPKGRQYTEPQGVGENQTGSHPVCSVLKCRECFGHMELGGINFEMLCLDFKIWSLRALDSDEGWFDTETFVKHNSDAARSIGHVVCTFPSAQCPVASAI
ncbi:Uncharacterized protein Fot_41061 [Forsythia ovata]|uniref:Uncharacterized protein n=1 Tax=Forsythia ovata TaxID=205694 RepID=A0ABD1RI83_9LAMI